MDDPILIFLYSVCALLGLIFLARPPTLHCPVRLSSKFYCNMSWKKIKVSGPMPPARGGHSIVLLDPSRLILFGGASSEAQHFDDAYILDLKTFVWHCLDLPTSPPARSGHSMVVHENNVYVFGGQVALLSESKQLDSTFFNDVWRLNFDAEDHNASVWTHVETSGRQPPGLNAHSAVVVGDQMIVFGGSTMSGPVNDTYVLDFSDFSWTMKEMCEDPPPPREMHACVAIGSDLFVMGGRNESGFSEPSIYQLDVLAWKWLERQTPEGYDPVIRCAHGMIEMNGWLTLFGGINEKGIQNSVLIRDVGGKVELSEINEEGKIAESGNVVPTESPWEEVKFKNKKKGPPPLFGHSLTKISDNTGLVFGGVNQNGDFNDIYVLKQ